MDIRKIVAGALLVLILVFVFMNLDRANIWFFGIRAEMPLALLVLACAGLGFGAGQLLAFINQKKQSPKPPKTPAAGL
ncbi:MAG: hypothetical protein IPJ19_20150 [Planctomycetes bacterium]|nr:hypothetical protein [Planctomycetota bacterium]